MYKAEGINYLPASKDLAYSGADAARFIFISL
jgi:hypothetical protein